MSYHGNKEAIFGYKYVILPTYSRISVLGYSVEC